MSDGDDSGVTMVAMVMVIMVMLVVSVVLSMFVLAETTYDGGGGNNSGNNTGCGGVKCNGKYIKYMGWYCLYSSYNDTLYNGIWTWYLNAWKF